MSGKLNSKSGVYTATLMLLLGLVAAAVAWAYNFRETDQALQAWGPEAVRLIRDAKHVAYAQLADPMSPDKITLCKARCSGPLTQDISQAKGLLHLRRALLDDRSFDWQRDIDLADVRLEHLVAFHDGQLSLAVYFTADWGILAFHRIEKEQDGQLPTVIVCSVQPIAEGLQTFFDDMLADNQ